jgi:hypothetical protein
LGLLGSDGAAARHSCTARVLHSDTVSPVDLRPADLGLADLGLADLGWADLGTAYSPTDLRAISAIGSASIGGSAVVSRHLLWTRRHSIPAR